jgi:L-ascorbate metabolism protein UlaG (beta-lactamase superfamily)
LQRRSRQGSGSSPEVEPTLTLTGRVASIGPARSGKRPVGMREVSAVVAEVRRADLLRVAHRARIRAGELALWYTGGAGYVLRTEKALLLIDPFVGPGSPPDWVRATPPALDLAGSTLAAEIGAVILSHEHEDHADPEALAPLARMSQALVIGSAASVEVATRSGWPEERCQRMSVGDESSIADLRLTAVSANDPEARGALGYVLDTGSVRVLHCGDSLYHAGFADVGRRWTIDALCVSVGHNPIGLTYYMDESDAARAARDARARILIPHHYDLWQGLTLDPLRVETVARWYAPETQVVPAKLRARVTIAKARGARR